MTKFFNYLVKSFKILVAITISKINSTFSFFSFPGEQYIVYTSFQPKSQTLMIQEILQLPQVQKNETFRVGFFSGKYSAMP